MFYSPIIKLGEAETRAVKSLTDDVARLLSPVIEITRGRGVTIKKDGARYTEYPHDKRLRNVLTKFKYCDKIFLDVTNSPELSNEIINELFDPEDGYKKWIRYVDRVMKEFGCNIIPSILLNFDDIDFESNFIKQVQELTQTYKGVFYRCNVEDVGSVDDLSIIKSYIGNCHLFLLIDCGYIQQAQEKEYLNAVDLRIVEFKKILKGVSVSYIVSGTSFPDNISEIGLDNYDYFSLAEVKLCDDIQSLGHDVIYSDYGLIAIKRNDRVIMTRGWVPRIDVPTGTDFYYYRKRRDKVLGYGASYVAVAKKVIEDRKFPKGYNDNWGIQQIKKTANGELAGASPSFWISVRMNIHLQQQIDRIINPLL